MGNVINQAKNTSKKAFKTGKEVRKQGIEWKKGLSGAFSNEQLFFSFVVLGVFYSGYLFESVVTDKNKKDEMMILSNQVTTFFVYTLFYSMIYFPHLLTARRYLTRMCILPV